MASEIPPDGGITPGSTPGGPPDPQKAKGDSFTQQFQHAPLSARVPDKVASGIFSTGVIVLDSPNEFILDFIQGLTRPLRVAARIVLTPMVMDQFVTALRDNLQKYEQSFGPPPTLPKPPTDRRPSIQEIYDELKLPDELLSGTFANTVMIGHSPAEFFLDFITRFYPTAAVSARIYLAAPQVPRMLETLTMAFQNFHRRYVQGGGQQPPPPAGGGGTPPPDTGSGPLLGGLGPQHPQGPQGPNQ